MTSRDFCYWLQGYFELNNATSERTPEHLSEGQVQAIKNHLKMVFVHEIDPSHGNKKHQEELVKAHQVISPAIKSVIDSLKDGAPIAQFNC